MKSMVAILALAFVLLAASAPSALAAMSEAECSDGAGTVRSQGGPFKDCVAAAGEVTADCCGQLADIANYVDCFDFSQFQSEANGFLSPVTNVDAVKAACLGRRRSSRRLSSHSA